ncbi:MAG: type VI secretion system contractile sheath small subunit [Deltaproteobacteria bacterium]|nr:type VI secretion system contractile sheath small subunit [Deltaproteobacteria bacterium]
MLKPRPQVKERVTLTYKTKASDSSGQELELPFKILVCGDFSHSAGDLPLEVRPTIMVSKENFDQVVKGLNIKLDMVKENHLAPNAQEPLKLSLSFNSLDDFEPKRLAESSEPLNKLLTLVDSLARTKIIFLNRPNLLDKIKAINLVPSRKEGLVQEVKAWLDKESSPAK